ncbi:MAG: acyl-CoA dehydrogenase [Acidimicrobiales bacterium]|nr:acyl-CoA dehydrogenase [Acidimicrobiales bacterium]
MAATFDTSTGLAAARGLRDLTAAEAAACESARTLTPTVVDALWESGLLTYANVAEAGGCAPSFAELIEIWIELACQDGSLGWIGIANMPSAMAASAYLPDAGFAEMFGDPSARVTVGGQFFPNGTGEATSGGDGYVLSGAWSFGSGTGHSEYVACGFFPVVDGEAVFDLTEIRAAFVPRADVTFADGWHVQGLRGTGSYDYSVEQVFVPAHRCFPLFTRTPERGSTPVLRMGLMPVTAAGHAGWALGVARSMLDDVAELAQTKARMSDMETLALRPTFQRNLAHFTGCWRAARAGVLEAFDGVEQAVAAGQPLTTRMRADLRVAATYATEAAREVTQWAHLAAGTTAIRDGSRLERAFRDMYTGTQHAFISEKTYIDAAQVFLGLQEDSPGLCSGCWRPRSCAPSEEASRPAAGRRHPGRHRGHPLVCPSSQGGGPPGSTLTKGNHVARPNPHPRAPPGGDGPAGRHRADPVRGRRAAGERPDRQQGQDGPVRPRLQPDLEQHRLRW